MVINRKIVTINVDIATSGVDYNTALKSAWDVAASGGDYYIAHIEKREAGSKKEAYTLWLEEEV